MKYIEFYKIIDDIKTSRLLTLENESASTLPKQLVFFHYVKALSLLDAIQILSQKKKTNEAGIILRSLLNLFINLKWLTSGDPDARMQKYADFEIISKKRKMDLGGILPESEEEKQKTKEIEEQYKKIIKKYNLNSKDWKCMTQWSGKSIRQMAIDVNLLADYEKVYSYLSFDEHTDPSTARRYLSHPKEEGALYIANPDDYLNALILWTSIFYYFEIEKIVAQIFNVTFKYPNIDLNVLANKYLKEATKGTT